MPHPHQLPSYKHRLSGSGGEVYDDDDDDKQRRPLKSFPSPSLFNRYRPCLLLAFSAACLLSAAASLAFAISSARRPPRVVTAFRCGRAEEDALRIFYPSAEARPKVLAVVGVHTDFGSVSAARRSALRATWFPPDPDSVLRLEQGTGLAFRFVVGQTEVKSNMTDLQKEVDVYHDFLIIDTKEEFSTRPQKTLAFLKAAYDLFNAEFYVKVDDGIYLRPDRLATLLAKDRSDRLTYVGCMKKGPVVTDPNMKWYEPSGDILGNEYFMHAYGHIYALSSEVVAALISANNSFRMFKNEDVTIGLWMLAMNVKHEDIREMCDNKCTPTSIAVWDDSSCYGLCNAPEKLKILHNTTLCSKSPTLPLEVDDGEYD